MMGHSIFSVFKKFKIIFLNYHLKIQFGCVLEVIA